MTQSDYDYTFKVLLIGNTGVGKSSILERFTGGDFRANLAKTIGVDFKTKCLMVDGTRVKLQIWDTAGQERFRTITSTFYRGAMGVVIVYDVTDNQSFMDVLRWSDHLRTEFVDQEVPLIFIGGNKCDLESERQVLNRDGRKMASQRGFSFLEISARSGFNIQELFGRLAAGILQDKNLLSRSSRMSMAMSETVRLSDHSYDTHSSYYNEHRGKDDERPCCSS